MKARRRGIGIAPFIHFDARNGWVVSTTPRQLYPEGRDPVPVLQEVYALWFIMKTIRKCYLSLLSNCMAELILDQVLFLKSYVSYNHNWFSGFS
jgi:hypothetical protein